MPRIRCHYLDCIFLENGRCEAASIEIDPDTGCATYSPTEDDLVDWDDDDMVDWESDEDDDNEDDDLWLDEEEGL